MNYYNEHDPNAATWLEELVAGGDLPPGLVDDRDVQGIGLTEPLDAYNQCHFFAGIGGWSHALDLAGWPRDRAVWSASLPCQPFSDAGKSLGTDDERHLWPTFHRLVEHYRPECVVGEQVASKAGRAWFSTVQADLEKLGYRCGAVDLCAAGIGSPHIRQRLYWCAVRVADGNGAGLEVLREQPPRHELASVERGSTVGGLANDQAGRRGAVGGMGHAERIPTGRDTGTGAGAKGETQLRPKRNDAGSPSDSGGVADNNGRGRTEYPQENIDQRRQERRSPERDDSLRCGDHGRSPWENVIAVPCADGKSRLLESCSEPLADGFPAQLVRGGDPGAPQVTFPPLVTQQTDDLNDTSEARTMRLKGYGNAIVTPLAAEFISAFMEVLEEKKFSGPC